MAIDRKKIWTELATKEANGKKPLATKTPENIDIKPFYDAKDLPVILLTIFLARLLSHEVLKLLCILGVRGQ